MEKHIEGQPYTTAENTRINVNVLNNQRFYLAIKRTFDVIGSTVGLVILSPVFLVLAVLIKLDDPKGAVFFSQVRIGKDGRKFRMYKLRSMCVDAEERLVQLRDKNEIEGNMFKMKNDPRATRIGHFIRKTSLDELPQLYNVLRGDMTLVGPRPCLPSEFANYTEYDKQRLLVTPGCTGLWQVSGRNGLSFDEMVKIDLHYIEHRSVWNDIDIMFRTVKIIFVPNQAY